MFYIAQITVILIYGLILYALILFIRLMQKALKAINIYISKNS